MSTKSTENGLQLTIVITPAATTRSVHEAFQRLDERSTELASSGFAVAVNINPMLSFAMGRIQVAH